MSCSIPATLSCSTRALWQVFLQHSQWGSNILTCANNPSLTRIMENCGNISVVLPGVESRVLPKSSCPGGLPLTTAQLSAWCCTSDSILIRAPLYKPSFPGLNTQFSGCVLHCLCPGIPRGQICRGGFISGLPAGYFCSTRTLVWSATLDLKCWNACVLWNHFLTAKLNATVLRRSLGHTSFCWKVLPAQS